MFGKDQDPIIGKETQFGEPRGSKKRAKGPRLKTILKRKFPDTVFEMYTANQIKDTFFNSFGA